VARVWADVERNIRLLNELLREIGTSVEQIVQGYPEGDLYLRLLGLKEEWTEQDSKFVEELVRGTRHHRNHRDVRIYIGDLLLGWVVQDAVTMLLRKAGYECHTAGADAARQLLTGRQVTEEPDLWLRTPTGEIWWLDVLTDYPMKRGALSYWLEKRRCDLRDNKFKRLMEKREEGARVGLIGVSIGTKKYFGLALTDDLMEELENPPKRNRRIQRIKTHWPYGGKPAISLNLRLLGVQFHPFHNFQRDYLSSRSKQKTRRDD
jgi:hypothetical protein